MLISFPKLDVISTSREKSGKKEEEITLIINKRECSCSLNIAQVYTKRVRTVQNDKKLYIELMRSRKFISGVWGAFH